VTNNEARERMLAVERTELKGVNYTELKRLIEER